MASSEKKAGAVSILEPGFKVMEQRLLSRAENGFGTGASPSASTGRSGSVGAGAGTGGVFEVRMFVLWKAGSLAYG